MKNRALFFFFFLASCLVKGQQQGSYTQYNLNKFALNPALAGIQPCGEFIAGQRRQWVGFEGAPETNFAGYNTRVDKDDKYPKNFHGYGFQVVNDEYGFTAHNILKIGYAYNMKTSNNYRASVGIFAGVQRISQSYESIRIANKAQDPALDPDKEFSNVLPEISPGAFFYNKNGYLGLSMIQAFPAKIETHGTEENRLSAHYYFMAGYRLRGKNIDVLPSMLMSFSPLVSPTVDLTLTLDYKQKFSLALGSKYLNSGYAIIQLRLLPAITLGYSYEYALNELNTVAPTTHEFVLRFKKCTGEKRKDPFFCPAYQ